MGSDDSETEKRDRVLAPDDLDITNQPEVAEIDDGRYVVSSSGPAKEPDRDLLENPDWLTGADAEKAEDDEELPPQSNKRSSSQQEGSTAQRNHSTAHSSASDQSTPPQSRSDQPTSDNNSPRDGQPTSRGRSGDTQSPQSTDDNSPPHPSSSELAAHDQPPAEPPAAELTNENVSNFLAESLAQTGGEYGIDATINVEGQVNRGRMTSDDVGETLETLLRWYARQTTEEVEPEVVLGIILAGSDLAVEYPVQSAYRMVKQHGLKPDDSISDLLAAVRNEGSFTIPPSKD